MSDPRIPDLRVWCEPGSRSLQVVIGADYEVWEIDREGHAMIQRSLEPLRLLRATGHVMRAAEHLASQAVREAVKSGHIVQSTPGDARTTNGHGVASGG